MTTTYYKILDTDGLPFHGGVGAWDLPKNGKPGKWRRVSGPLLPCWNGLHVCRAEHLIDWLGPTIWIAETKGRTIELSGKVVARQVRLVGETGWNERIARLFAADCAEHALQQERAAGREPDLRSWEAVEVARKYANGEIDSAACSAARSAADSAACSAAYYAAYYAAYSAAYSAADSAADSAARSAAHYAARSAAHYAADSAARSAAYSAAYSAADSAARKWQTQKLLSYLNAT